jgi:squalene-hopene/tetraprenyl-beta-curcumene cyclase
MNTTDLVQFFTAEVVDRSISARQTVAPSRHELAGPVRCGIVRARRQLIDEQRLDGSWASERAADVASLVAFFLQAAYLGCEQSELADRALQVIQRAQLADGGWACAPRGPFDLDTSVLAYLVLKLAGHCPKQPEMGRARQAIRALGGADRCCGSTRLWLALFGQVDYEICPTILPEGLLAPSITAALSAEDERMLAAQAVVWALRPLRKLELSLGVRELFVEQPQHWPKLNNHFTQHHPATLAGFWSGCERLGFLPLRKRALDRANFLLSEATADGNYFARELARFAWQRVALDALGHKRSSRVVAGCDRQLRERAGFEPDEARSSDATTLTSDTALVLEALVAGGLTAIQPAFRHGIEWLVDHRLLQARRSRNVREMTAILRALTCPASVGAAAFGTLPPDVRLSTGAFDPGQSADEFHSATQIDQLCDALRVELRQLQQPDGGWIPAPIAPARFPVRGLLRSRASRHFVSAPDLSGAVVEVLSTVPRDSDSAALARARAYLAAAQRGDGSWLSSGGERMLLCTTWAIRAALAAGAAPDDPPVAAAINWLLVHQHASGGWSEPAGSTSAEPDSNNEGTIIETAAAILALVDAGLADHDATRRAIAFLIDQQDDADFWNDVPDELASTSLHCCAWSLMALARWIVAVGNQPAKDSPSLRLVCDDASV